MKIALCMFLSALITGCSAFRSHQQILSVITTPQECALYVNGQIYKSPANVLVKRNHDVTILCMQDGYYPYQNTINSNLNETAILDIIGTVFFLFPGVGLLTPGAWSLETTSQNITLIPVTK